MIFSLDFYAFPKGHLRYLSAVLDVLTVISSDEEPAFATRWF